MLDTYHRRGDSGDDVWTNYSTRDAAEFVGLTESAIRSCVRSGVVAPRGERVPLRFSFQDLIVLKLVKQLVGQGVTLRRVRTQLGQLAQRCPDTSLSSLSLSAHNGQVIVRDDQRAWRADSGQLVFGFELQSPAGEVAPMPIRREAAPPEPLAALTADEWFDRALSLEESDPAAAVTAYEHALHLRPYCSETLINLGRLCAENGDPARAADCFKRALDLDPRDATALYNLGVVAQDAGRDREAVQLYERSLEIDSSLAEAHYNLATIFDRTGDPRAAIRHINEYRKLTRNGR